MKFIMDQIRNIIYIISFLLSVIIYLYIFNNFENTLRIIRLTQFYAFAAVGFLYITLLSSPLYSAFPAIPLKPLYFKAQKALGLSAFYFALLHATITFFKQLGGFAGLPFLGSTYILAISLSFTALIILSILAITSHNYFKFKLGKYWKIIHRFIYLASVLIIIHALLIGTHFSTSDHLTYQISLSLVTILIILEAVRFNKHASEKYSGNKKIFFKLVLFICVFIYIIYFYIPLPFTRNLNTHNHK